MSKSHFAAAGLLAIAIGLAGSAVQAASPLSPLAGTWSGGGTLSTNDGQQERLRCRASYDVAGSGSEVQWSGDLTELGGLLKMVPRGLLQAAAQKVIADVWAALKRKVAG